MSINGKFTIDKSLGRDVKIEIDHNVVEGVSLSLRITYPNGTHVTLSDDVQRQQTYIYKFESTLEVNKMIH